MCALGVQCLHKPRRGFHGFHAKEGGQLEAELSNTETLYQAASVMVVSDHSMHSRRERNKGEKPFYSTMPCCLYTTKRLFNWNVTLYFDKDIEVQRLQLGAFIITFPTNASSQWAERENNKSKATEPGSEPSEPITDVCCSRTLIIELWRNGDDVKPQLVPRGFKKYVMVAFT